MWQSNPVEVETSVDESNEIWFIFLMRHTIYFNHLTIVDGGIQTITIEPAR